MKENKMNNLERMMARYLTMKEQISTLTDESKELSKSILQKMKDYDLSDGHTIRFEEMAGQANYKFTVCTRVNDVSFDYEAIKDKMTKEEFKFVNEVKVTIDDLDGFVKFMKENGIKFKDVEPFLTVDKSIKLNKVEELYKNGFDMKKLKGLISLKKSEYLSTRRSSR